MRSILPIIKLNFIYKCRHCSVRYVILRGRYYDSFLPVEIITGKEIDDGEYDKEKHVSHLLNCPELQLQWKEVKKIILDEERKFDKTLLK